MRTVIYHAGCMDGFTAAWAAYRKWGHRDTDYVEARYGDAPPAVAGKEIWILDFSYPREVLEAMAKEAASIRVLDHHESARVALEGLDYATFDMDRSGAGLAWDVLHGSPRPWLIDHVEDVDLWRFKVADSRATTSWLWIQPKTFKDWSWVNDAGVGMARASGAIVAKVTADHAACVSSLARRLRLDVGAWNGLEVAYVNAPFYNVSFLLEHLNRKHKVAIAWSQLANGTYKHSIRSQGHVDVQLLARHFGGGGHPNAAGFTLDRPLHQMPGVTELPGGA